MYQLSHLLIEQRNILQTLREENSVENSNDEVIEDPAEGTKTIFSSLSSVF